MNPLIKLAAAFSPPAIDKMTLAVYVERLGKENPEHVAWACEHAIDKFKHFPRVSELLELVRQRKLALNEQQRSAEQKRMLKEPVNNNRPNLMQMLEEARAKAGKVGT